MPEILVLKEKMSIMGYNNYEKFTIYSITRTYHGTIYVSSLEIIACIHGTINDKL